MVRAVVETNILLAALRSRNGASFEVLRRYRQGEFSVVIANTVLTECEEVLKREGPTFGLTGVTVNWFLDALCAGAEAFRVSGSWKPSLPDADDEPLAQLALEGKVGYLVTHNLRHFPAERLSGVGIVSPSEFLQILKQSKP